MLSCRPDEIAICRQVGLISDDELGVRPERKGRKQLLKDLGKPAAEDMINSSQRVCGLNEFSKKRSQCS